MTWTAIKKIVNSPKSFEQIPTLWSAPLLGHSYLFLPKGKYQSERLTEAVEDLSKQLGPIFKLKLGGTWMVISTNPDHAKILYRNEGIHPERPSFPALIHYRKKRFHSVGVVPGNGTEWYRYRKGVLPLLQRPILDTYVEKQKFTAENFVQFIRQYSNEIPIVVNDLYQCLLRFSIEAISHVSPGKYIPCILENQSSSVSSEIIEASVEFMDGLYRTLIEPPLWKFWKTTGYRHLESSHNTIFKIISEELSKIKRDFDQNPDRVHQMQPYIWTLLKNTNFSYSDVVMLAMEVFLGGIDATATTMAFTIYYLAKNPEMQDLVRRNVDDLEFLRACIKETLRLSPTAGANGRFLQQDADFDGFLVPKGTLVSIFSSVTCRDEKYFPNALDFDPNRWLRSNKKSLENFHPFASLPFGHGPRMCPGKRLAENELIFLLQSLLKNFQFSLPEEDDQSKDIGMLYRMNRIPDRSINVKFTDILGGRKNTPNY